jgi:hypothetical protein
MSRITYADLVIDALVAAVRALPGYRAPTERASGITVYDSVEFSGDRPSSFLIIGYGGQDIWSTDDGGGDFTRGDVSVRAIATTSPKEEEASIDCLAVYTTGDGDVAAARTAAVAIGSDVDTALRAAPKIGISSSSTGQLLWTQVTEWSLRTYVQGSSLVAELRFTLTYHART